MIKNKKILIFLIAILILFYLLIDNIDTIFNKKYSNMFFIGDFTKIEVKKDIISVYNDNSLIKNQKVNFYFKDREVAGYITSEVSGSNGGEYVYVAHDNDGNLLSFENSLFGYTKNLKPEFLKVENTQIKEMDEVINFMKSNNIALTSDMEIERIIVSSFDFDKDGKNEFIYSVNIIKNENKYDSFVFMKKDDEYILIAREESDYVDVNFVRIKLFNIVDFNNDGDYEFVISRMMSEYGPNYYELYNFDGNKFTKLGGE